MATPAIARPVPNRRPPRAPRFPAQVLVNTSLLVEKSPRKRGFGPRLAGLGGVSNWQRPDRVCQVGKRALGKRGSGGDRAPTLRRPCVSLIRC